MSVRAVLISAVTACFSLSAAGLPLEWKVHPGMAGWPLERLIENTERFLEREPESARGWWVLGRIHGLAFVLETRELGVVYDHEEERLPELFSESIQRSFYLRKVGAGTFGNSAHLAAGERLEHLTAALRALRRALQLDPDRPESHLSYAYVLESGAHLSAMVDTVDSLELGADPLALDGPVTLDDVENRGRILELRRLSEAIGRPESESSEATLREITAMLPELIWMLNRDRASADPTRQLEVARLLRRYWLDRATDAYERAFRLAVDSDRALEELPPNPVGKGFTELVSYEAGSSWMRLVRTRGCASEDDTDFRTDVIDHLKQMEAKPPATLITPIVLALDECSHLEQLLAPETEVLFDLNGDGVEEAWPWLRPNAGFLVWDPEERGEILSGRQMFGSATGWFFFQDGYHALDALDDDRDGRIADRELHGLAVWFDRDTDGVSDPGEVQSVGTLGIEALATRATQREGLALANPCGVELCDGRVLPSFDWITAPLGAARP